MKKVSVNTNPGANGYAGPGERIVEYSAPNGDGGLILFAIAEDGHVQVHLYRHDPTVEISVGKATG